jgi:signal transduction histidine kinase
MEFSNVTFTAYFGAAVVAAFLAVLYIFQYFRNQQHYAFAIAAFFHAVYMSGAALSFADTPFITTGWLCVVETLHYNAWVLAIALTIRKQSKQQHLPNSLQLLFSLGLPFPLAALFVTLNNPEDVVSLAPWFALALSVISLVSVEQLYRYAAATDRHIKLLCLSMAAIFIYDVYRYAHIFVFQNELYPQFWESRAALSIVTSFLMALGGLIPLQQSTKVTSFTISRPIAFYTTSLIGIGIAISLLSLGGYYVRLYGGNWTSALYSVVIIIAILAMVILFISNSLRSQLSVLINKHLFRHKYDYRSEWLRIINFLAQPAERSEVNQRAFFAATSTTKAPGGAMWLLKQGYYTPVYQLNLSTLVDDDDAVSHNNNLLPYWARNFPNLWLIFPMIVGEELVGFTALTNPQDNTSLTWEDLDLLKTIGSQLASYLKRYQQAEQLAESKQFDTYNKLVAFIIHDLNNLIAQQALMVKNAEKHKDNPAFVTDAFHTISNSVDRMNNLLKKLRRDDTDLVKRIKISDAIEQAVAECKNDNQKIKMAISSGNRTMIADQVRLVMTLSNFIKNAQEATVIGGTVNVSLRYDKNTAIVSIEDNGYGMDWDFIHNRLFKPFETTKSDKGMGIGAYLSREYINELGGALNVLSNLGEGTTISISLPLNDVD